MTSCLLTRRYFLKKRRGSKATMMTAKTTPRTASVEATIASVVAVDKPGLSRQADSAPAVTRDHENRTRSNLRAAPVEATIASVAAIDEHVRPSAEPDPPTTSLAESVCWHDPHDRDDRYNQ
ncbi:MAG TPA: hypothetical protein VK117_14350 [Pyrinomonadaceae bacterium]|nr:hypothetical protein [Pyrinomonadaceae bacterium]